MLSSETFGSPDSPDLVPGVGLSRSSHDISGNGQLLLRLAKKNIIFILQCSCQAIMRTQRTHLLLLNPVLSG